MEQETNSANVRYNQQQRAEFPEYAIEAERLKTFREWPIALRQTPEQMSDAGFFYTLISDRVVCFYCGGGLREWRKIDNPWEQHALWYDKCNYVLLMRGPEYIEMIKEKFDRPCAKDHNDEERARLRTLSSSPTPPTSSLSHESTQHNNSNNIDCSEEAPKIPEYNATQETNNKQLLEMRLCKICYINEFNTAFFPCGHMIACAKCALSQTKCPICRKNIEYMKRIYLP